MTKIKLRRLIAVFVLSLASGIFIATHPANYEVLPSDSDALAAETQDQGPLAVYILDQLEVKGRAPRTGYSRDQFGNGWGQYRGCDMRNIILKRDLHGTILDGCLVLSGTLEDPYTGKTIHFVRGSETSAAVQIEHVVAVSDAWQKGASAQSRSKRIAFFNDPLNLLAIDGPTNQAKGDSDAASWLPPNKSFRCEYISRQIAVKYRYSLWVTPAEREAMERVLRTCPLQKIPPGVERFLETLEPAAQSSPNEKIVTRTIFSVPPGIIYRSKSFPSRVPETITQGKSIRHSVREEKSITDSVYIKLKVRAHF